MKHVSVAVLLVSLALLGTVRPAAAQASAISFYGGLALPAPGSELVPGVEYKDVYGKGLVLGGQYRYLLTGHMSAVAEVSRGTYESDPDNLKLTLDLGNLEVEGGNLVRWRFSAGVAYETNPLGPNIFIKALVSHYNSAPESLKLTAPETGEVFVQTLASVSDWGVNLGGGIEIPVKQNMAVAAGGDVDIILDSELFELDEPRTLVDITARAGIVIYF